MRNFKPYYDKFRLYAIILNDLVLNSGHTDGMLHTCSAILRDKNIFLKYLHGVRRKKAI